MKQLSVIIPAYNEAERLPQYLSQLLPALRDILGTNFEVIVVDDGSADQTASIAKQCLGHEGRVISLPRNRGKGAAIRAGVEQATGQLIAMTDADGAASTDGFRTALEKMSQSSPAGVIGRRYQGDNVTTSSTIKMSWRRKILGNLFARILRTFLGLDYADTQCGFKVFNGPLAKILFRECRIDRFGIDFEFLYIASQHGIRLQEIPIKWTEIPGSKVNVVRDGSRMLRDIFTVRSLHKPQQLDNLQDTFTKSSNVIFLDRYQKPDQNERFNQDHQQKEKRVGSP